jgi:aryl-alcohol dehydrogenase-like predicted oxidoreductase
MAIAWISMNPAVTCSIPGCKRVAQVDENIAAAGLPRLAEATMKQITQVYERHAKPLVHHRW